LSRLIPSINSLPRAVLFSVGVTLLVQLFVAFYATAIGDEIYFMSWGNYLSWGYYDHPPLTGWLAWLMNHISLSGIPHRVLILILSLVNLLLWFNTLAPRIGQQQAAILTALFMAIPYNVLIFSTFFNDSIVYLMLSFFFLFFYRSYLLYLNHEKGSLTNALWSGVMFGLAMLTKYTASIFFVGLTLALLIQFRRNFQFLLTHYLPAGIVAFAFFLINLIWNYQNCGINLAFNFVFRHSSAGMDGVYTFILAYIILVGPIGLYAIWSLKKVWQQRKTAEAGQFFFTTILYVTVLLFLVIAYLRGQFGVHWAGPIVVLGYLGFYELSSETNRQRWLWINAIYSVVMITLMMVLVGFMKTNYQPFIDLIPEPALQYELRQGIDLENGSLSGEIRDLYPDRLLTNPVYSTVGMLEQKTGLQGALMFNVASKFGRNSDIFIDYKALDGANTLHLANKPDYPISILEPYFDSVEKIELSGKNGTYMAFLGNGFNYQTYRQDMIQQTLDTYYKKIPSYYYGACYMDRYQPWN
jgi:uncharacterized membrane protein YidH (DUF202 family)